MRKFLKIYTVAGILFTIGVGSLAHFIYQWTGENPAAALFVPVNESTWEHLKLLFFPMMVYSLWEVALLHGKWPELFYADAAGVLTGMLSIIVLFYTYTGVLGRSFFPADLGVFCISVILAFLTSRRLLHKKAWPGAWKWPLLAAVTVCAIAFFFFTWNPPELGLFRSPDSVFR